MLTLSRPWWHKCLCGSSIYHIFNHSSTGPGIRYKCGRVYHKNNRGVRIYSFICNVDYTIAPLIDLSIVESYVNCSSIFLDHKQCKFEYLSECKNKNRLRL